MDDEVPLLDVRNLRTSFFTDGGEVKAVDDVSYFVRRGEVVAIVGESGCGKSITQQSLVQLVQTPPGRILGGSAIFEGRDLMQYGPRSKEIRAVRGAGISMIFQEPMTSLNPVLTIGRQLSEVIRVHLGLSRKAAWARGTAALEAVGIPEPARRMASYSFEMSGGMRQRVMIAIAVACGSKLIIADEPTTALDVTTQAQVMELLLALVRTEQRSLVVITHNLGLVTRYADRVYVMYAGKIIESGTTEQLLTAPRHPYTAGLLYSIPRLEGDTGSDLRPILGLPPNLQDLSPHCAFEPRCPYATAACRELSFPALRQTKGEPGAPEQQVACHYDIDHAARPEELRA
ncbi:ABC transporter ATP-binding protein [Lichenicola cladoniae]|uniref:ABC transporter ATP-binding protein n=1 Tax=Lichenicola cladoniae TaxID=1484109 RepID=A0A6M8HLJ4_9PROT|nr:ABC transporter ATP-binding protein [Lichenicola cladoniae]NPD66035.1 ABC transporter ATP-binding protein [Acetobacteraceae bacterium]QKE89218.1 ABC transporter ATP-binding protein [Lichenicola cladoniae]